MIFVDIWFLQFLVVTVLGVWVIPEQLRRMGLLIACLAFHAHYAGPAGMTPIIVLAGLTYFALNRETGARVLVILISAIALLYYKYTGLFKELTGVSIPLSPAPLAISFFVFEFIHLLTDRNHKKLRAGAGWLDFSIFTIFFPSLASGPIKRYQQFQPELNRLGRPSRAILLESLARILFGYFKKFCIADGIAHEAPTEIDMWHGSVLVLALLQGIRIYMDFSGYSDIALGLAGTLNIRLPENFSFPYFATNISDFWRRWHISLSTWIRDYIYILLGGNRVSPARRFGNLIAAMVLCGLWHGAAIHFVLWGLAQGLALLTVHFWRQYSKFKLHPAFAWALTFVFVQLTWLLFFYDASSVLELFKSRPFL